jgi:8-oxo-dGTP pyrophosphatase MutT (NUDIX family)
VGCGVGTLTRPTIRDPRAVPLVGDDAHLPRLDEGILTAKALASRLSPWPTAWEPEFRGDGSSFTDRTPAQAAVLVGLVVHADDDVRVLLTQRPMHLRDHAGQVSFPGGRCEPEDADAAATALREAHEEVGLDPARVQVLGSLPTYTTVTRFEVTPVLGLIDAPPTYRIDPTEVAAAFEVPLLYLMDPARHRRHRYDWDGRQHHFLSMPWRDPQPPHIERFIWGATAAMLRNLYRLLGAAG